MMGMIKRSVGYKALITVTSYLYTALVCSNFGFNLIFYEMRAFWIYSMRTYTLYTELSWFKIQQYPSTEYKKHSIIILII